jgi:hypothetical protein
MRREPRINRLLFSPVRASWMAVVLLTTAPAFAAALIYLDTHHTYEERAADLVSRMTLDEKISQLQNDAAAIPRLDVQPITGV